MTCFRDGANGFISKPFDMDAIRATIQRSIDSLEAWEDVFPFCGEARYLALPSSVLAQEYLQFAGLCG